MDGVGSWKGPGLHRVKGSGVYPGASKGSFAHLKQRRWILQESGFDLKTLQHSELWMKETLSNVLHIKYLLAAVEMISQCLGPLSLQFQMEALFLTSMTKLGKYFAKHSKTDAL